MRSESVNSRLPRFSKLARLFGRAMPLRVKIVLLVAGALILSLLSYLYVGSSLIVKDKTSYLYDYSLARVRAASERVEGQLTKAVISSKLISSITKRHPNEWEREVAQRVFDQNSVELGIKGLIIFRTHSRSSRLSPVARFGLETDAALAALKELKWNRESFESTEMRVGSSIQDRIPVAGRAIDRLGRPAVFFAWLKLDLDLLSTENFHLTLIDPAGKVLARDHEGASFLEDREWDAFIKFITQNQFAAFDSGVRDWESRNRSYIVGYERLASKKLIAAGVIPKEVAFRAAVTLKKRSILLGVSILLLVVGFTLILVRRLTDGLRQMWKATQKVSEGDFSARVHLGSKGNDEIGDLADSFNAMATRIDELMEETADKAKLEKELETAQAVQNSLFPTQKLETENLVIAGRAVAASKCGGDWWYYSRVGDVLVYVIGDVLGHGVSAALLTATAHGAFTTLIERIQEQGERPEVKKILVQLNRAILAASHGDATMTFLAATIDLKTGEMEFANASQRPPMLFRRPAGRTLAQVQDPKKFFKSLVGAKCPPLGQLNEIEVITEKVTLYPGDRLFWYTDGLVECENDKGKVLRPITLVKMLAEIYEAEKDDPEAICERLLRDSMKFFGSRKSDLDDDITIVVGVIPDEAQFEVHPEERAG